jgi:hypothetical protein
MNERASLLMQQFLAWVADRPRTREQAVEAWHSCPHISVWEDAVVNDLVRTENNGKRTVALTPQGEQLLQKIKSQSALSGRKNCVTDCYASGRTPGCGGMSNTLSTSPIIT